GRDALVPIVVGIGRVLDLDLLQPGILARRLIKMRVNADVALHSHSAWMQTAADGASHERPLTASFPRPRHRWRTGPDRSGAVASASPPIMAGGRECARSRAWRQGRAPLKWRGAPCPYLVMPRPPRGSAAPLPRAESCRLQRFERWARR